MAKVEFVSYTGEYPNLCSGILVVKIDGKEVSFGYNWDDANAKPNYPPIWKSGGEVAFDDDWNDYVSEGDWLLDVDNPDRYPKFVQDAFPDIIKVMNESVPHGCCGGCV